MRQMKFLAFILVVLVTAVNGATLVFNANPLAGNPALTTPGRQIVNGAGGGPVFSFDPVTDIIGFDPDVFGFNSVQFAKGNTTDPGFPTTGVTVAVVQNASAAGAAATALADQLTTATPGFFIYFNAGFDVPRLVFSTDLNDADADLAILARFNNLSGQPGVLSTITAANFAAVPEPSSFLLALAGLAGACLITGARRRHRD
jgi:hypothetical protein